MSGEQDKARDLVREYYTEHGIAVEKAEVYVVWYTKTLGNWKALVSTHIQDGLYFEVTYNGEKKETYVDMYQKVNNRVYPDYPDRRLPSSAFTVVSLESGFKEQVKAIHISPLTETQVGDFIRGYHNAGPQGLKNGHYAVRRPYVKAYEVLTPESFDIAYRRI